MLAVRIIPSLLCRGRQLVKGQRFNAWRSVGIAAQAVRIHQARGVDELLLLDIAATREGRGPDLELVSELTEKCFMPLAVGGGIKILNDVRALLRAGADKVVIGSGAKPDLLQEIASRVGSQALVVSMDCKDGYARLGPWEFEPASHAATLERSGAGEILLQSMDREGTMGGYDLELIRCVCHAVDIPVIASGGCRDFDDMHQAIKAGASAVSAGALFQFTDATPRGAAQYLHEKGIEVRL